MLSLRGKAWVRSTQAFSQQKLVKQQVLAISGFLLRGLCVIFLTLVTDLGAAAREQTLSVWSEGPTQLLACESGFRLPEGVCEVMQGRVTGRSCARCSNSERRWKCLASVVCRGSSSLIDRSRFPKSLRESRPWPPWMVFQQCNGPCNYREGDIDKDGLLYRTCRLYVGPVVIRCKDWICVEPRACPSKNDGLGPRRRQP